MNSLLYIPGLKAFPVVLLGIHWKIISV